MATALSAFTPYIMLDVPGCPEPVVEDSVRRAAIEFCRRTRVIRELITVNTVAAQDYVVLSPVGGNVERVYRVMIGDTILEPTRREDFNEDGDTSQPLEYYIEQQNKMRFYPVPDAIYSMAVHVAVTPNRDATTLDDVLFTIWRDEIAAGACAILKMMTGKPWHDMDGASISGNIFSAAIDRAAHQRAKGGGSAQLRSRLHTF